MKLITIIALLLSLFSGSLFSQANYRSNISTVKNLVLDNYPADAGYSVYKIRKVYSGSCLQVQKQDSSRTDIRFLNNMLDTAQLRAFAAGADVRVRTFYDQSGNGRNAIQLSYANMPTIATAGVVTLYNNRPTLSFTAGSSNKMVASGYNNTTQMQGVFNVFARLTAGALAGVVRTGTTDYNLTFANPSLIYRHRATTAGTTTIQQFQNISSAFYDLTKAYFYVNKTLIDSSLNTTGLTFSNGTIEIGSRGTSNLMTGLFQTGLIYSNNVKSNRTAIENAIELTHQQNFNYTLKTFYLPNSRGTASGISGFTNTGLVVDEKETALRTDGKINVWMSNWGGGTDSLKQSMVNMLIDPNAANLSTAELIADAPVWSSSNPPGGGIQGIAIDTAGTLWISGLRNYTKTGTFIRKLNCLNGLGGAIAGLAYDKNTNQLIASGTGASGTIYFVDIATDAVVSSFSYTGLIDQIYYDANQKLIYATPLKVFSRTGTVLTTPGVTLSRTPQIEGIGRVNNLLFLINNDAGYHQPSDVSNIPYANTNNVTIYRFF